jgi:SAM-dependent methyltransferase
MNESSYFDIRLKEDIKRTVLWKTLVSFYFSNYISPKDCVLELGSGYCDFINNVQCSTKIAVDIDKKSGEYADKDVEFYNCPISEINFLNDNSIDLIFSSNLFEHLDRSEISSALDILFNKLKKGGKIIFLQPNFRFAYANYFDDYTHKSIWSDVSFTDFLKTHNFHILKVIPRFLPLSIKSRLPTIPVLIKLYLYLPFKPFGKQMLIVASK